MGQIETLIGAGTHVQGDVQFCGGLHVDGCISGNVRADASSSSTLSVSRSGRVEGAVEAVDVILDGMITGPIRAGGRVVLGERARVLGDVYYGIIEIALGAEIMGRLVPAPSAAGKAATAQVEHESL